MSTKHRRTISLVKFAGSQVAEKSVNLVRRGRKAISINLFLYLSNFILVLAILIGLYNKWLLTSNKLILCFTIFGLIIFASSAFLVLYTSHKEFGFTIWRLWIGVLLGILAFTENVALNSEASQVMDSFFLTSICLNAFDNLIRRLLGFKQSINLLSKYECIELIAFTVASSIFHFQHLSISLLSITYFASIIGIRLKSYGCLVELIAFLIAVYFEILPKIFMIYPNLFVLSAFVSRFCFSSVFDLYFGSQSQLERWKSLLIKPAIVRKLFLLGLFTLQITFFSLHAALIKNHKEWFIVIPIYIAFSAIWFIFHLAFIACCWTITNRITLCNNAYLNDQDSYGHMLASRGVRHLALTSTRLISVAILFTFFLTIISWTTKTATSLSLAFLLMAIELSILSLIKSFGNKLGGTCIGYALISPALKVIHNGSPTLLNSNHVTKISVKATSILNHVQTFFSLKLIDNAGCDYTSSGISLIDVETKLSNLFQKRTADGPRYDTYILFFSGSCHPNGDWALADQNVLKLDSILEWWKEKGNHGSRLILIMDTDKSYNWLKTISRSDEFVALQTWKWKKIVDIETCDDNFTIDWILSNSEGADDIDWLERSYHCVYSVSSNWLEFQLQMPSSQDVVDNWGSCVPKIGMPLLKFVSKPHFNVSKIFWPCECFMKFLRRTRIKWISPRHMNTSHGFNLFRT